MNLWYLYLLPTRYKLPIGINVLWSPLHLLIAPTAWCEQVPILHASSMHSGRSASYWYTITKCRKGIRGAWGNWINWQAEWGSLHQEAMECNTKYKYDFATPKSLRAITLASVYVDLLKGVYCLWAHLLRSCSRSWFTPAFSFARGTSSEASTFASTALTQFNVLRHAICIEVNSAAQHRLYIYWNPAELMSNTLRGYFGWELPNHTKSPALSIKGECTEDD